MDLVIRPCYVHHVHSIASIYMVCCLLVRSCISLLTVPQNDDFYMTKPLTPVTFYTQRMSLPSLQERQC